MSQDELADLNASLLHDAIETAHGHSLSESLCCRNIRPIARQPAVVGPAHTLRISRATELDGEERKRMMHAYDSAPTGTMLVVEVVGSVGGGVVGDVVANRLKVIGVKGAVVDGCIRDVAGIEAFGFPLWSREVSMAGMVPSQVRVEVGVPVNCGGVTVNPGDLIAADMDGVFVCPLAFAKDAVKAVRGFVESERKTHAGIKAGKTIVEAYPSKSK